MFYLKPFALHHDKLPDHILKEDKLSSVRFGSCSLGNQAIYLGSFYINRFYYIPRTQIQRVFKRIAMTKNGGFQLPYLVVLYGNGKEKKCIFHIEEEVDALLHLIKKNWPEIPVGKAS